MAIPLRRIFLEVYSESNRQRRSEEHETSVRQSMLLAAE
jgi:hypothetical protein